MLLCYILCILVFILLSLFIFNYYEDEKINLKYLKLKYKDYNKLNDYIIFGTHISNSYNTNNFLNPFIKTQTLNIKEQLKYNVRYFDLRFKINNNDMFSYHNFIYLNNNYKKIFDDLIDFLNKNEEEFIIVVMKNEEYYNHEKVFRFLENNYIKKYNKYNYFVWNNKNFDYIPKINEIRKKIFMFNCYKNLNFFKVLNWKDNKVFKPNDKVVIEDYYNVISINKKFETIKETLIKNENLFIIVYVSFQNLSLLGINKQTLFFYKKYRKELLDLINNNKAVFVFDYIELFL